MSKLISGKEALIAIASGEKVLIRSHHWDNFDELTNDFSLNVFFMDEYEFKLKPRTISINGVEAPAPFEPKAGDMVWCLNELSKKGYEARTTYDSDDFIAHIAYWRTEEEIKQVVGALRSIFK